MKKLGMALVCNVLLILGGAAPGVGQEPMTATAFIWPVLMDGVTDPRMNTVELRASTAGTCVQGLWSSYANDFGARHCNHGLPGCSSTSCYHPGEDWNTCPPGSNEAGKTVFAVANGKVLLRGSLGDNGFYLILEHKLPSPEFAKDYTYPGTGISEATTFDTVYSGYLHIDHLLVDRDDVVVKGQPIAKISSCCSHLHFELNRLLMTSASSCPCGYCTSPQKLTDVGYIHPARFIRAHLNDLSTRPLGSRSEGRLAIIGPPGAFGASRGTISARICGQDTSSCRDVAPQILAWAEQRVEIDLSEKLETPVVLRIQTSQGDLAGVITYPFIDVPPLTWYGRVTTSAWTQGLVTGKGQRFFAPEEQISRAEFVEMLAKVSGAICGASCSAPPYSDVASGDWFYASVRLAHNLGWLTGTGTFRPHDRINRAEAAAILVRATACSEIHRPVPNPYVDVTDTSSWFYEPVYQAREFGLMKGYREGFGCDGAPAQTGQRFFCPAQPITRAEALQAIANGFMK